MEGWVIFWLVPVFLLITLILLLVHSLKRHQKPFLNIVEPLGFLIKSWNFARTTGDQKQVNQLVGLFKSSAVQSDTPAWAVISNLNEHPYTAKRAEFVRTAKLPIFGEQRIIEHQGEILSVIVGLSVEVLPLVKYISGTKQLSNEERLEIERTARNAASHGYLALAVAYKTLHGTTITEPRNYTWAGQIILEPVLEEKVMARLRSVSRSTFRFLSVLPTELLERLLKTVRLQDEFIGIGKPAVDHPKLTEEYLEKASCIGEASLKERYTAVRFYQHHYDCRLWSTLPEDKELPVTSRLSV